MKPFLSLLTLLLLGGCMMPESRVPTGHTAMKASGPVATLEVHRASPIEFFTGYDARCQILSIDGVEVDSSSQLLPGNHALTVTLNHLGRDYLGDVDLIIPEPKNYALKAQRKGESFTLSIIDVDANKVIATSTALLDDRMKFLVFVVQK